MRAASSSSSARIVRDHRFRRLRRVDARRIASARATDGDDERASTSFSIVPADAEDGLRRYRAVLAPLFLAGGFLHVPDLFGAGPISGAFDASSLGEGMTSLLESGREFRMAVAFTSTSNRSHPRYSASRSTRRESDKSASGSSNEPERM